jgi:hypothetical protein
MNTLRARFSIVILSAALLATACHMDIDPPSDGGGGLSAMRLDKNALRLDIGQIGLISLQLDPADVQQNAIITWAYDPSIVKAVCDNYAAVVTAVGQGTTAITATMGAVSAACSITVSGDAIAKSVDFPYIYSNTEYLQISPGETERVSASLFGGSSADAAGFAFVIDKPNVASLVSEGNYVWITGQSPGVAKVTVHHNRSAYPYSFLVSCQPDGTKIPYLTTDANIVSINKSEMDETTLYVDLVDSDSPAYENQLAYAVVDSSGLPMASPPISLIANGRQLTIRALSTGECHVSVTHPDAPYPFAILVRVDEIIENVYIEPSSPVVYVSGEAAQILSVSLVGVPPKVTADVRDFSWEFEAGYDDVIGAVVYGSGVQGAGDSVWITGKQPGTVKASVSHPLAAAPREIYVIVKDIKTRAAAASFYITTSQNYIVTKVGADPTAVAVYINNALPGDENGLHWAILNEASDDSHNPVVSWDFGSGTSSSVSRQAVALPKTQMTAGNAVISPLRPGTATITISHAKAVYDAVIIVAVKAETETASEPKITISTATPSITLQNGSSRTVSVALSGEAYEPGDENLLRWSASSDNLSIAANGLSASLEAAGTSVSTEYVVVSHPKSSSPLNIPVIVYNTAAELAAFKCIVPDNPYRSLYQGQTAVLSVTGRNLLSTDAIDWRVASGQYLVSVNQINKTSVSVTASYPGVAVVSAKIAGAQEEALFYITISTPSQADDPPPAYLTTGQNVVTMKAGDEKTVYVAPVGIPLDQYGGITWRNDNPSVLEVVPNGDSAAFRAVSDAGKAAVTVSSPLASNSLTIYAHVGDEYEYKNPDHVYISAPDTLTLQMGAGDAALQAVLAHSNSTELGTAGFSFSIANPAIASLIQAGNRVFVAPVSAGNTVLTVSNPAAVYPKEVLIIVEKEGGNAAPAPYITTSNNVLTVVAGETVPAVVSLVNYSGADASGWTWTSENPSVASPAANNGTAAMIRGYEPGTTYVAVRNNKAAQPLKLIVICLDAAVAQQHPWIKTNVNILNLRVNSSSTITAEMIGAPEDNSSFLWSVNDGSFALLSGGGQSVSVKGLREGTTYIAVRNSKHTASYSKTILVIVDKALTADNYIALNNTVLRLKPNAAASETIRASLAGGSVTDPQDFVWWADDYNLIHLDSVTDSAQVRPLGASGVTYVHVKHPKARDVLDVLVIISNFDKFAFSVPSKSVSQGQIYFIPLEVPPTIEKTVVKYTSYDDSVCAVTGGGRVAMIAGIKSGQTTVKAELSNLSGVIATAELAVIVRYQDPNANKLTVRAGVLNLKDNESLTVQAALQGSGVAAGDESQISWKSSDPSVLSLLSSSQGEIRGNSARLTAHNGGKTTVEAVLTLSHPKCESDLNVWVVIPGSVDITLILDQTYLEIFKEDGAVTINATLVNASSNNDYNNISWSAPKSGGAVVVNVVKSKGASCNIVPRSAGQTTLRAQLPNGVHADCIVIVKNSAELAFETENVHVVPGFSETVSYSVNPQNANVYWIVQYNGPNGSVPFDYFVDEVGKTITITAKEAGAGSLTGYFSASNGGAITSLNVYCEYTYDLTIDAPLQIKLQPDEKTYRLPFTVYPRSMTMEAFSSNTGKLQIRSISLDARTGKGYVEVAPMGEQLNLTVTVKASNPRDPVDGVRTKEQLFHVYYDDVEFDFEFDYRAGAFSYFNPDEGSNGTLHLGDGETMTFRVKTPQKNLDVSNLQVTFSSPLSGSTPHARLQQGNNGGYIRLFKDPPGNDSYWSLQHVNDVTDYGYVVKYKLQITLSATVVFRREHGPEGQRVTDYDYNSPYYFRNSYNELYTPYTGDLLSPYRIYKNHSSYKEYPLSQIIAWPVTEGHETGSFLYSSNFNPDANLPIPYSTSPISYYSMLNQGSYNTSSMASPLFHLYNDFLDRFSFSFKYTPITPYKINVSTLDSIQNYLPQYFITAKNPKTPNEPPKTYCLYDLSLLDRYSDSDPTVDARYQAGLNITYTRTFDGKTYTHTVPASIDQRSCPAYMKQ